MANVTPRVTPSDKTPDEIKDGENVNPDGTDNERDDAPELRGVEPSLSEKIESGEFTDDDADEQGWISYTERWTGNDGKPQEKAHRIPVQHWKRYERHHNL